MRAAVGRHHQHLQRLRPFNTAAGIRGAAEDPAQAGQCISPDDLGELVKSLLLMPDHLVVPDITIQPLIQEITPM